MTPIGSSRERMPDLPEGVERHRMISEEDWLLARRKHVTASVIGCFVGVHDFVTPFELWAHKTGAAMPTSEETPAMRRGKDLESFALARLAKEKVSDGWEVVPNPIPGGFYFCDESRGIGATPDAFVFDPARGWGVVQVKSVHPRTLKEKWTDPDTRQITPPLWIACQAITEARLTGVQWVDVVALVIDYGIDLHIYNVPLHPQLIAKLESRVAIFWRAIEIGARGPLPDFVRDAETIRELYSEPDGSTIDLSSDERLAAIVAERDALMVTKRAGDAADKARKPLDTEIVAKLGNATSARLGDGRIVTAALIKRDGYEVGPTQYRQIKIGDAKPKRANRASRDDDGGPF